MSISCSQANGGNVSIVAIAFYGNANTVSSPSNSQIVVSRTEAEQSMNNNGRKVINLPSANYSNKRVILTDYPSEILTLGDIDKISTENPDTGSVLYWEHYNSNGKDGVYTSTSTTASSDYIIYNNLTLSPITALFTDYLIPISWDYGSFSEVYGGVQGRYDNNLNGIIAGTSYSDHVGAICATIKVDAGKTYIRVYASSWNCTGVMSVFYDNGLVASRSETSGDAANSVVFNFMINATTATTVDLVFMAENYYSARVWNVGLTGIVICDGQ